MNRLYVVENRFTLTGAMADHRLRFPASQIPAFTHALASKIAVATQRRRTRFGDRDAQRRRPRRDEVRRQWLTECANDLIAKAGRESGRGRAAAAGRGAVDGLRDQRRAEKYRDDVAGARVCRGSERTQQHSAAGERNRGRPDQAAFHFRRRSGLQRAARARRRIATNEAAARLGGSAKEVPDVVRLGYYEDATSALSQWHVPAAHYLESGATRSLPSGAIVAMQPMILPLFGGLSEIDLLNGLLGGPKLRRAGVGAGNFPRDQSAGRFRARLVAASCATVSPRTFRCAITPPKFNANAAGGVAHTLWSNPRRRRRAIRRRSCSSRSYSIDDGRYINNGWLQEMPDPITKLTWDNAALMSPAFAQTFECEEWRSDRDHRDRNRSKSNGGKPFSASW